MKKLLAVVLLLVVSGIAAAKYLPTESEARVAVKNYYRMYALDSASVQYRYWRFKVFHHEGAAMRLVRVEVNAKNRFGGYTGWQDTEFATTCVADVNCVAVQIEYGGLWGAN